MPDNLLINQLQDSLLKLAHTYPEQVYVEGKDFRVKHDKQQEVRNRVERLYDLADSQQQRFIDAVFFEIFGKALSELIGSPERSGF